MPKILVKKSNPLKGSVKIDGAKNAVLPIIAATLLAKGKSTLNGVPNLKDVHVISDLLRHLGAEGEYNNNTLTVDATNITTCEAPYELVRKMRASFLVMGPLLARFNHTKISMPGGCAIGTRPIDLHLKGFKHLGAKVNATDLRAGAALILCGLIAEGETQIGEIYHIQRGYVDIDKKITALGGNIQIIED